MLGNGIEAFGLRDDAALLELPGGRVLLASVDSVVEGVHVDLTLCSPGDVGWKALMGALSDLAAMGATPLAALVALCVPGGSGEGELAMGVMSGVAEASAAACCPVAGGDVSGGGELVVAVTVLGTVEEGGPPPVGRSGARPGDVVLVTGPCGGSAAGLRALRSGGEVEPALAAAYRRPVSRLREGELARFGGAHAMIDVSDGLALDLHRLADASGVGFELESAPIAPGATRDEALGGGEDYELALAAERQTAEQLSSAFAAAGLRRPLTVGVVTEDPATRRLQGEPVARMGWQHRLG
ncbi:MAG TPA: thiamine-phosphate kinase [Acidimicrobiales bacterium]|nr:thiamine-phosphate kinase [Acidimicrobiales bacterium]